MYGAILEGASGEKRMPTPESPYAVSKLAGEQLCLAHAGKASSVVTAVALRLGPRQRPGGRAPSTWSGPTAPPRRCRPESVSPVPRKPDEPGRSRTCSPTSLSIPLMNLPLHRSHVCRAFECKRLLIVGQLALLLMRAALSQRWPD
ncbi:NAD-dependent epimerase/dehydratase family protein [Streptomyces sp. LS1784]|uniref:NAD-dependent epimerase/dehydratase family protein n=1 Tax=Streptomyces sp. LS1784 TaxID=2851533 RepID=UPI0027DF4CDC|nr:NAD-dependent epimerase/dehydratase family protein [Streptomyces sp. LS1784]